MEVTEGSWKLQLVYGSYSGFMEVIWYRHLPWFMKVETRSGSSAVKDNLMVYVSLLWCEISRYGTNVVSPRILGGKD